MKLLEREMGEPQRDDRHEGHRLWRSPDHTRIRYDAIDYSCEKTVLHFRSRLGNWRDRIMVNTKGMDARSRPAFTIGSAKSEDPARSKCANRRGKPSVKTSARWSPEMAICDGLGSHSASVPLANYFDT